MLNFPRDSSPFPQLPEPGNTVAKTISTAILGIIIAGSIFACLFVLSGIAYVLWRWRKRRRALDAHYSSLPTAQTLDNHGATGPDGIEAGGKGRMREERGNGLILEWARNSSSPGIHVGQPEVEHPGPAAAVTHTQAQDERPGHATSVGLPDRDPTPTPPTARNDEPAEQREEISALPVRLEQRAGSEEHQDPGEPTANTPPTVEQSIHSPAVSISDSAPPPYSTHELPV